MPDPGASGPPPPHPPTSPRKPPLKAFGGYEIEGELGRGGMGVVYLARQVELNRHVALKMLTGHYGPDELRRFLEEAETAAGLSHSNIAHIYEVGEHEGAPFFSMEYVENGSLADRLRKDLPEPRDVAELLIQVARALHFAHQNGVVHRDMKPANVLLDQDGVPKVADFGIAKRLKDDTRLTRSGAVIGTPTYMAPEQAKGHSRHAGPAADIYSLGAILYEMLAGRPPFLPEDSETAMTVRVLTEDPVSPAWHRPEVPRDLETICMKCLQKEPRHRYASAADLAEDLRRFLDDESILAKPPNTVVRTVKWVRRHPWRVVAGALLALLAIAAVMQLSHWFLYTRPRTEYAAALKIVHGRTEPDTPLTAAEAGRREVSFRVTRKGWRGPVTRVEAVNPRAHPAAVREVLNYDAMRNWLEGLMGLQKLENRGRETTAIEFIETGGGGVEWIAYDRNQNINWRMLFEHDRAEGEAQLVRARVVDLRGYDIGQWPSRVEFRRDARGRDLSARFFNSTGQPATNEEGVYGYTLEWGADDRISRLINLGRDGNTAPNNAGIAGYVFTYNSRGQVAQTSYLGVDGKPTLYNGVAAMTAEYDAAGNPQHFRYLDPGGRPVNSSNGLSGVDYVRNAQGQTGEMIWLRLKQEGKLEAESKMAIEYDANGYASDVRSGGSESRRQQFAHDHVGNVTEERHVDLEGKPVLGANGWSIRRKSFTRTKDPAGWREEETYFGINGEKTYHKSGHHRTIIEFDEVGRIRLFVNEDLDRRQYNYYRYISISEYEGGKTRRTLTRFEDSNGQLTADANVACHLIETLFDSQGREAREWRRGCKIEVMGSPVVRADMTWYESGTRKTLVRDNLDENEKPVPYISTGTAAHFESEFDESGRSKHISERGFDEKVVGFSTREAIFAEGAVQSVTHKRSDGSVVGSVNVYIKNVNPEQPKAAELRAGDQLVASNGKPVTSAYAWVSVSFPGGSIEVLREGRRIRIEGFTPGKLGITLEDRAPAAK